MKKLDLKAMVTCAALIAAAIVLSRFLSINAWNLKIGFTFVPVFIAAYLYGPIGGAVVGGIADFIGAILFPIGAYFPGFTLTCVITGAVYGLLLHKKQIRQLQEQVKEKGMALVPVKMYFKDNSLVKVELAVARGKKLYDKREDMAKRDMQREIDRALKQRSR